MIRTERTFLRNLCQGDLDSLYEYRNDARCNAFQRYEDTSRAYLKDYIDRFCNCALLSAEEEQHYAVCLRDGCMIGDLSVFYTEEDNCFTVGITISHRYQRQGYAYEVLDAFIAALQKKYPTVDVVALIERENVGSIALFRKLGFVEECYADSIQSYVFVKSR